MNSIEPNTIRVGAIGVRIRQRRRKPAAIPFFAANRTGMAPDTGIKVNH
jgi:hypothetical protein